jgi:glycosyltransferase involved in cell wall biosynthesis
MDTSGGAARAAMRLHRGLQDIGVDSRFIVQTKTGNHANVFGPTGKLASTLARARLLLDQAPVIPHWKQSNGVFAPAWLPGNTWRRANAMNPDIIHLHWITKAFMSIGNLARLKAPLLWTMHDMWAFTGGCHYDLGCGRFRSHCGACPVLGSHRSQDLSYRIFSRKMAAWKNLNLTVISPSKWLAGCVRDSALLGSYRIEVIPNGIDLGLFYPTEMQAARYHFSLPADEKLVLFGAMNSDRDGRKGYTCLAAALRQAAESGRLQNVRAIIFGANAPAEPPDLGLPVQYMGNLSDDRELATLYSAADVFVAPSLQDNLPNTVMEALACGTPCVGFSIGGLPDMVIHEHNGYLARPYESADLSRGIAWVLENKERRLSLSENARLKAETSFNIRDIAGKHLALYKELLDRKYPARAGSMA